MFYRFLPCFFRLWSQFGHIKCLIPDNVIPFKIQGSVIKKEETKKEARMYNIANHNLSTFNWKKVTIAICIGLVGIIIASYYAKHTLDKYTPTKQEAYAMSCQFMKSMLKAPPTAKFPSFDPSVINATVWCTSLPTQNNHIRFMVRSYVDSQNSFGAQIRTYYTFVISYGNFEWKLEDMIIDETI